MHVVSSTTLIRSTASRVRSLGEEKTGEVFFFFFLFSGLSVLLIKVIKAVSLKQERFGSNYFSPVATFKRGFFIRMKFIGKLFRVSSQGHQMQDSTWHSFYSAPHMSDRESSDRKNVFG